jgi:hypothetical protein
VAIARYSAGRGGAAIQKSSAGIAAGTIENSKRELQERRTAPPIQREA